MPTQKTLNQDYASIIEDSLNEVFIFDATTLEFILVNQGARNNIGYSMTELQRMTPLDIKPEHTESSFQKTIQPLHDHTQEKILFQTIHQRKDGSQYPVEVHLQKREFSGQPVFIAIILDISEREKNQSDLNLAHSILESAPDAMVVVDSKGMIQLANKQMSNLFGYTHVELISMNVDAFVPLHYRDKHPHHRAEFAKRPRMRGMGSDLQLVGVDKDGKEIPIEVSLSPISSSSTDAESQHLIAAAIRDVTDRKKAEKALYESESKEREARQIAETATRTKTRFLAAASHDLRQPLQALRLYLSAMTTKIDDLKALELSKKMHLSLDTMGELLESLLDISSLESGSIQAEKSDVPVKEIIQQIMAANSPQAESIGLTLEAHIQECVVFTDPALLQRIIENFLTNAIRYTESGTISLLAEQQGDMIKVSVEDSGIGIPKDKLDSIFEEYYQVENNTRDRNKGLGLGLSIVKHIARILDHPISASSKLGVGSKFSVDVPLGNLENITNDKQKSVIEKTVSKVSKVSKVLIIDDEPAIVDAMREALSSDTIEVTTADSGLHALAVIDEGYIPDFIITDFQMPGLTGIETMKIIRERLGDDIPVVIITGDTTDHKIDDNDLANCSILTKPINVEELLDTVNQVRESG